MRVPAGRVASQLVSEYFAGDGVEALNLWTSIQPNDAAMCGMVFCFYSGAFVRSLSACCQCAPRRVVLFVGFALAGNFPAPVQLSLCVGDLFQTFLEEVCFIATVRKFIL